MTEQRQAIFKKFDIKRDGSGLGFLHATIWWRYTDDMKDTKYNMMILGDLSKYINNLLDFFKVDKLSELEGQPVLVEISEADPKNPEALSFRQFIDKEDNTKTFNVLNMPLPN